MRDYKPNLFPKSPNFQTTQSPKFLWPRNSFGIRTKKTKISNLKSSTIVFFAINIPFVWLPLSNTIDFALYLIPTKINNKKIWSVFQTHVEIILHKCYYWIVSHCHGHSLLVQILFSMAMSLYCRLTKIIDFETRSRIFKFNVNSLFKGNHHQASTIPAKISTCYWY